MILKAKVKRAFWDKVRKCMIVKKRCNFLHGEIFQFTCIPTEPYFLKGSRSFLEKVKSNQVEAVEKILKNGAYGFKLV